MRPHEEAKLLSPEELEAARIWFGSVGPNGANGRLLLAHIAALEADSAARLAAFGNYVDMHGVEHDLGCPEDDTCECPLIVALKAAFRDDSPGATLLSEHAKALEAAHADGRRHALLQALDRLGMDSASMYRDPEATDVRLSDELWEHVRWIEVRARNEGLERAKTELLGMKAAAMEMGHDQRAGAFLDAAHAIADLKETEG